MLENVDAKLKERAPIGNQYRLRQALGHLMHKRGLEIYNQQRQGISPRENTFIAAKIARIEAALKVLGED